MPIWAGYPKKETVDWLKKIAAQIKKSFGRWEEYAVSVMAGGALHFESSDPVIPAAYELFGDKKPFLDSHPVSDLQARRAGGEPVILPPDTKGDEK
ncbi:MAG: DUF1266 domain-containing protein [Treponema sp.]|nr:DUF1266 domain-containing protein [Treponema sp.]